MPVDAQGIWHPRPKDIADANATLLAQRLGQADYDALYRFSVKQPADYWAAVNDFCGIVWSRDYECYVDLSAGKELPRWFVGGELNWVDTVLAKADDPALAATVAIVAERENGETNRVTYTELRTEVHSIAAGLLAEGIERGDRIGLLMESGIEATVALLAIGYIGAIAVPLFSGFGIEAIVSRLEGCTARGLIATDGFPRRGKFVDVAVLVTQLTERLPLDLVVLKQSKEATPTPATTGFVTWSALKQPLVAAPASARMSPSDPFMVIFTSGTTGKPKGAVHTHGGFPIKIAHDSAVHFDVKAGDVFCWPADMGWIAGSLVLASALLRGATLVCYDGAPDFPDWSRMADLVERHRVTHYGASPTLIRGLAANEKACSGRDLSSIRVLITAGEAIAPEHFLWFQRVFGRNDCPLINYTGGTEVSGALLSNVPVRPIVPSGFNSPSPGIEVEVVDLSGRPLRGETGELAVLNPFVGMTQGFWQDQERYIATYWRTVPGLWVHGDLAMRDETGVFFLLGRSDDTIKIAGKRVGPGEVEQIVVEIEGIAEVAVIGVEDGMKGQSLVIFVTARSNGDADAIAQAVSQRVRQSLGKPFAPKRVYLVPQLPKTRSAKIMRRIIRSIYANAPPGDLSSLINPDAIDEIRAVIGRSQDMAGD